MRTYFAVSSKLIYMNGYAACLEWATALVSSKQAQIVKIIKARPAEKESRLICEVTKDGIRNTPHGRVVNLKLLLREKNHGKA